MFDLGRKEWNKIAVFNNASPLHSWEWARLKEQSGVRVLNFYRDDDNLRVAVPLFINKFRVAWLPDGLPYSGSPSILRERFLSFLKDNGIIFVITRYMPYMCDEAGIKRLFKFAFGNRISTFVLDLKNRSENDLFSLLHATTRKHIRRAQREGYSGTAMTEKDLEIFWNEYETFSQAKGFSSPFSREFYFNLIRSIHGSDDGLRLLAEKIIKDGKNQGFMLTLLFGKKALELLRFDYAYFKESVFGPKLLSWGSIKSSLKSGVKMYDFGGVIPKRQPGVFRFKSGFGGQLIESSPYRIMIRGIK